MTQQQSASHLLRVMSREDQGGAEDAVAELRRAALWGDMDAQFNLGLCYHDGTGVAKSHVEAAWWFRRAAKQGHPVAEGMIDSGGVDSGTENSELHDEDSDGWEFIEDDFSDDLRKSAELQPARHRHPQALSWEILERDADTIINEWEEKIVHAPKGRLNVVFITSVAGPRVKEICSIRSPLAGEVIVGDIVLSLNGVDVRRHSGPAFAKMLRSNSHSTRQLLILTSPTKRLWQEQAALTDDALPRVVSIRPDLRRDV